MGPSIIKPLSSKPWPLNPKLFAPKLFILWLTTNHVLSTGLPRPPWPCSPGGSGSVGLRGVGVLGFRGCRGFGLKGFRILGLEVRQRPENCSLLTLPASSPYVFVTYATYIIMYSSACSHGAALGLACQGAIRNTTGSYSGAG